MIKFALPGLYEHFTVNQALVLLKKNCPQMFKDGWEVGALYGNFQFCIWDGGRIFGNYNHACHEELEYIHAFCKAENIPMRLIYTNPVLQEEHLYDRFSNYITQYCESENNEIVVNSPLLEDFLRTNYPKYNFISSTTKCLNNPEASSTEFNKDYKYICLDYNLNRNEKFLTELSKNNSDKIELLINAICPPGCPSRKHHYDANGLSSLNMGKRYGIFCGINENNLHPEAQNFKNNLKPDECWEYEKKYGITYFKLEGRTFTRLNLILNYAHYLVKPEYIYVFIMEMLDRVEEYDREFSKFKTLN